MMVVFSRCIYQETLVRVLGLAIYEIFIYHTCVYSSHDSCAQICERFHTRLINEGQCVYRNRILL